jgi:hypothetical protein
LRTGATGGGAGAGRCRRRAPTSARTAGSIRRARTRTLDAHACRLRRKLHRAGATGHVVNRRGVGYRLVDRVAELLGESGRGRQRASGDGAVIELWRVSDAS